MPPTTLPPLRPNDLPGAVPPQVAHTVSHSVSTLGGTGTMGGTMGTMGGLGASAFGASALQMLTRSSMHLELAQQHAIGDSIAAGLSHQLSLGALAAPHPALGASLAHAAHAAVICSEVRTAQLAAGLYSQMDNFYSQHAAQRFGVSSAQAGADNPLPGMRSASRLPPLAGTDQGDYELAPADPVTDDVHFEMRPVIQSAAPPPMGYDPLPNPPPH